MQIDYVFPRMVNENAQCNYIYFKIFEVQLRASFLLHLFGWVYFQNIWSAVRGMSLAGGGVVLIFARAVRYIVGLVLTALRGHPLRFDYH